MGNWTSFFESLGSGWGYVFLFLSSLGENLFPPMPGDTVVILGAFMVGRGQLRWLPAYAATTAGSILGFMILFYAGFRWGKRVVESSRFRWFSQDRLERVEAWFDRYGYWVIGANRFLSGFRGVVSLAAGTVRMHPVRVFCLALISCLIWNAVLMGVGIWVGENWLSIVKHYQRVVFALIAGLLILAWVRFTMKRKKKA